MLLGLVLGIGGGAHGLERVVVLALGIQHPGGRDLHWMSTCLGPISVLGRTQLLAQLRKLGCRLWRRPDCPTRRPDSPGEMGHGFDVGQRA